MVSDIDPEDFYSDKYQTDLHARYHAAHAVIMASDYANLQEDIDSGKVWGLGSGAVAYAMKALLIGAVLAPPEAGVDADGERVPSALSLLDGRGSVAQAEAYAAAAAAETDDP